MDYRGGQLVADRVAPALKELARYGGEYLKGLLREAEAVGNKLLGDVDIVGAHEHLDPVLLKHLEVFAEIPVNGVADNKHCRYALGDGEVDDLAAVVGVFLLYSLVRHLNIVMHEQVSVAEEHLLIVDPCGDAELILIGQLPDRGQQILSAVDDLLKALAQRSARFDNEGGGVEQHVVYPDIFVVLHAVHGAAGAVENIRGIHDHGVCGGGLFGGIKADYHRALGVQPPVVDPFTIFLPKRI